jgi:hypothetical protein
VRTDGIITPTRVELGTRCYRRHVLTDMLEKGKYKSAAASFGNVLHAGVAEYWKSRDDNKVAAAVSAEYAKVADVMNEKHSLALALTMMEQYGTKAALAGSIGEADSPFQIVLIEERAAFKLDGLDMTFQLDRLLSLNNEELILVDAKSASRLDARWRTQWPLSLQMRLYMKALRTMYDMPVTIIIEGLQKGLPLKIEYYTCPDWSDEELDEAVDAAKRVQAKDRALLDILTLQGEDALVEAAVRSEFNYGDCHSYNTDCSFLELCSIAPNERKGALSDYLDIPSEY